MKKKNLFIRLDPFIVVRAIFLTLIFPGLEPTLGLERPRPAACSGPEVVTACAPRPQACPAPPALDLGRLPRSDQLLKARAATSSRVR